MTQEQEDIVSRLREHGPYLAKAKHASAWVTECGNMMVEAADEITRLRARPTFEDAKPAMEEALTALQYHIGGNLSPRTARQAAKSLKRAIRAMEPKK